MRMIWTQMPICQFPAAPLRCLDAVKLRIVLNIEHRFTASLVTHNTDPSDYGLRNTHVPYSFGQSCRITCNPLRAASPRVCCVPLVLLHGAMNA